MSEKKISVFETLFQKNVNENVEKKKAGSNQLSYLSWSWAWAEVKKLFPDATGPYQEMYKLPNGVLSVDDTSSNLER